MNLSLHFIQIKSSIYLHYNIIEELKHLYLLFLVSILDIQYHILIKLILFLIKKIKDQ
jgi:hypothetical protein